VINIQGTFKVQRTIVHEDNNKKWIKFKNKMKQLEQMYEQDMIVNEISNKALIKKIVKIMERYEK